MRNAIVRIAAAVPAVRVADCEANADRIIELVKEADSKSIKVLCFPELSLTGCTCGDLFLQPVLLDRAERELERVIRETRKTDVLVAVGLPVRVRGKLYNCAAVFKSGELLGLVPKTNIPLSGDGCQSRWFAPAPEEFSDIDFIGFNEVPFGTSFLFSCSKMPELCVGVELGEDLCALDPPSRRLAQAGATIILNPSAAAEIIGRSERLRTLAEAQSSRLLCTYLTANAGDGESTTDLVFAGHSVIAENGRVIAESGLFDTGLLIAETDLERLCFERMRNSVFEPLDDCFGVEFTCRVAETPLSRPVSRFPFIPDDEKECAERCETILRMQAAGLRSRMAAINCHSAVIGISGGLDSCLALIVTARAFDLLGADRSGITAITMPCFGTTGRTLGNARKLCSALGIGLREIKIGDAVTQHFADIGHDPESHNAAFENAQARERTQVLMDIANDTNGLVVGTGDLSELALGWATYNGDHMSMYGVNASIPKTLVRRLVRYTAETCGDPALSEPLLDILDTPVSPELLPAKDGEISQKTEDIVGPYELHDFFIYYALRWGFRPAKLLRLAKSAFAGEYDDETLIKWLRNFYRRFFTQQFKRSCSPDGPKIGSVTLSPRGGWQMPSDVTYAMWMAEADALTPDKK